MHKAIFAQSCFISDQLYNLMHKAINSMFIGLINISRRHDGKKNKIFFVF